MLSYQRLWLSTIALHCAVPNLVSAIAVAPRISQGASRVDVSTTQHRIINAIRAAQIEGSEHQASVDLQKSFDDSILFQLENSGPVGRDSSSTETSVGIEVSCNTCYLKGQASVSLTINDSFNTSQVLEQVETGIENTLDSIQTYVRNVSSEIADGFLELDFDFDDIPPPDIDFNVDIDSLPDVQLKLGLDELEIFMDMTTTLSGGVTYTINLYSSITPLGGAIQGLGTIGLVFSIDLILSVESEVQIANGFHIKLDDGVLIDIALFSKKVSKLDFNGGQFELLPVKIESSGAVFTSILQLGLHAGIGSSFKTGIDTLDASFGVETKVFANIAEFVTNVTASSDDGVDERDSEADELTCGLRAQHMYQFGLGAAAGATVALNGHIWGPSPETTVPIYYTTLADVCVDGTPTATPKPKLKVRQDLDEDESGRMSLQTVTKTATQCASSGFLNCPASLQVVKEYIATETSQSSTVRPVDFGVAVNSLNPSSGIPKPYTPPPPPPPKSTASSETNDDPDKDDSNQEGSSKKPDLGLIIGLSVGLGVPALLALFAGLWWCLNRRRTTDGTVITIISPESQPPSSKDSQKASKTGQQQTEITLSSAGE